MEEFAFYWKQGVNHITDLNGIDHIVFIITLCAVFAANEWRRLLVLITAFTIGHSITLVLAGLKIVHVPQGVIDTLIPVTIVLTSISNVARKQSAKTDIRVTYVLALFFGLIHGMGFSNFFGAMMMGITDSSIIVPLLAFNLGIEVGQIMIVAVFMVLLAVLTRLFSLEHRSWNFYISGAGGGIAATMILNAFIG